MSVIKKKLFKRKRMKPNLEIKNRLCYKQLHDLYNFNVVERDSQKNVIYAYYIDNRS
jgi:hypothetical protein